jgi:murein DD-endopeptidase MepM/ murein hydrolase activator NlpD
VTDPAPFLERWPWPEGTPITQEFGDMFSGYAHRGRDAGCPAGTPIVAEAPATVVACTNDGSFGIAICLDYGNGLYGIHAHNSVAKVAIGDRVQAGQLISLSGYTGYVQPPGPGGAHCHYQLCINTQFPTDISYSRDPRLFLEDFDVNGLQRLARLEAIVIGNGFDAVCRPGTEDLFPAGTVATPEGQDGPTVRLTGEQAVEYANRRGFSLGLAIELK